MLFFTKSSGYEHDAIKTDGKPGHGFAFRVVRELGAKNNIEFVESKDGSLFTPEYLAQFDAFLFYTSGMLTEAGTDKQPPMTAAGKAALLAAIASGKGFVATHSATDSFHTAEARDHGPARFVNDGERADPYVKMLGGSFIKHEAQQPARQLVADPHFPGLDAVPGDFCPLEEWYSLKDFAPNLHVLLIQDTSGMQGPAYLRPPYPSTWARMHGQGRVFYTSMGHREDIWTNPVFQSVLLGGLNWALHRVDADVSPNLTQVTPRASELPKYVPAPPPPPKKSAAKPPVSK